MERSSPVVRPRHLGPEPHSRRDEVALTQGTHPKGTDSIGDSVHLARRGGARGGRGQDSCQPVQWLLETVPVMALGTVIQRKKCE